MDPSRLIPPRAFTQETLLENLLGEQENLESVLRQQERTTLLKENIKQQKYAPRRISKAVNEIVAKKGINRNPAFREVAEKIHTKGENWNVTEGGGEASKPVNARVKKGTVAAPPVPQQPVKSAPIPAPWHLETANQKRKRLANAVTKVLNKKPTGGKRKSRKRKTRKHKKN